MNPDKKYYRKVLIANLISGLLVFCIILQFYYYIYRDFIK